MDGVVQSQQEICLMYETFGDCPNGNGCHQVHFGFRYDTKTTIATLAQSITWRTSGNFKFVLKGEHITYYIPRGAWYNTGAKQNDAVKLQISERRRNDGNSFARIVEVLSPCWDFASFSDCKYGGTCKWAHHCTRKQSFYIAKVLSITESPCTLEVEMKRESEITREKFHVPYPDTWHLKNAAAGNLVILQESSRCHSSRRNFGKIISILHESQSLHDTHISLERDLRSVFAIEQFQSTKRDIVLSYSVEGCDDHSNCKHIGVHIFAGALKNFTKKIDKFFVPHHRTNWNKRNHESFFGDAIRIAISLYAHSGDDKVDEPTLSPVFLPSERIINLSAGENIQPDYFGALWKVFGEDSLMDDIRKTRVAGYVVNFPKIWKTKYLVLKMRDFANKHLTMYLQTKTKNFAVAKYTLQKPDIPDEQVFIPADIANNALAQGNERKLALVTMLAFAKRSASNFWGEHPKDAYVYEVIACDTISGNKSVIMTSPLGQTTDYVNQQIFLSQMISPGTQLYSKSELLGILVRRYERSTMYTSIVTQINVDGNIELYFCGVTGRRRGSQQFTLEELFKGVNYGSNIATHDGMAVYDKPISFLLKGLSSDEYCNTRLATFPGKSLAALDNTLDKYGVDEKLTTERLEELENLKTEFDAPYERTQGQSTKVTLQRGVQLQLQIGKHNYPEKEVDNCLYLLKIGKDCHLCLVHLTAPKCAFKNNRSDTNELIPGSSLEEMEKAINKNRLRTSILKEMNIQWDDCYFSGGSFKTSGKIKHGNLLCIRKEISSPNFVWICHGVVSKVFEGRVEFLVCSLEQDQTPEMFEEAADGFIIEVIEVTTEDASPIN